MGWRKTAWDFVKVPEHSNAFVAIFSGLLFIATTLYAIFAGLQWYITRQAMEKDQRAWVVVREGSTEIDVGKAIVHNFVIINAGKTLATNMRCRWRMEILGHDENPSFDLSTSQSGWYDTPTLNPNDPFSMGASPLNQVPGGAQSQRMTEDLKRKYDESKIWFAMIFSISYRDIFGAQHWLNRCSAIISLDQEGMIATPSGSKTCTDYNSTDDN